MSLLVKGVQDQYTTKVIGDRAHNRSRTIRCADKTCKSFIVVHLGVLDYPRYLINVSFYGLESVDKHFNIEDIMFTFTTYNPQFTKMELWFRFFFAFVTCVVAVAFLCRYVDVRSVPGSQQPLVLACVDVEGKLNLEERRGKYRLRSCGLDLLHAGGDSGALFPANRD